MKTINKILNCNPENMQLIAGNNPEEILLFDIETTGFTSRIGMIYLIACIYQKAGRLHFIQWLCENKSEEKQLLESFHEFSSAFKLLVHYNGTSFDMPFVTGRTDFWGLSNLIGEHATLDLYLKARPYQKYLPLPNLKLKSLEKFFGFNREDIYDGGQLIQTFKRYCQAPTKALESDLLMHNEEDLIGLYLSLGVLRYIDAIEKLLFDFPKSSEISVDRQETSLLLVAPMRTGITLELQCKWAQLTILPETIRLQIQLLEDELKFFFSDFKNYYYLRDEDSAIHKSIAAFVDSEHKTKATKQTAYIKKRGIFIPLPKNYSISNHKTFNFRAGDPERFMEWTEDQFNDSKFTHSYFTGWLSSL